jgi:hypothetical protein
MEARDAYYEPRFSDAKTKERDQLAPQLADNNLAWD